MRTKSLLLAAALSVAGAFSGSAQSTNVYSVNAVGYVNITFKPGFTMIGNPLIATNNSIASLLPTVPEGFNFYRWNGVGYDINSYEFGAWSSPAQVFNPGDGVFVQNPWLTNVVLTFVGEVPQGNLTNSIPVGFSMKSSIVPQSGPLGSTLNFNPADGTTIYLFDRSGAGSGSYQIYNYDFGAWDVPNGPTLQVGQGFWSLAATASKWGRTFSANN